MTLHRLEVGKPYDPSRRSWPEAADYNYRSGEHELRLYVADPTPMEVLAVESGPVEFGMFVEPEGLFLVTRFGFGPALSFDTSYQWHRAAAGRVLPPPTEEASPALRALLGIILVDAATGLVRVLRAVTYSPEFTRAIHRAIARQAASPFDAGVHERWADGMLRYSTAQLWDRCTTRCRGGD
jgi:hypothetical protein